MTFLAFVLGVNLGALVMAVFSAIPKED